MTLRSSTSTLAGPSSVVHGAEAVPKPVMLRRLTPPGIPPRGSLSQGRSGHRMLRASMSVLVACCWLALAPAPGTATKSEVDSQVDPDAVPDEPVPASPPKKDPGPKVGADSEAPVDSGGPEEPEEPEEPEPDEPQQKKWWKRSPEEEPGAKRRKFLVGVEGLIAQAPPLRPTIIDLDPRFLGRTVALGGLGLFGRYRPVPLIGIEAGVRSASLRYADRDSDGVTSQDNVLADVGVLLYVARGEVAQFAFDAGIGGAWGRIAYEPASGEDGTQTYGSGLVRVGADAEFLVKRIAFTLSLRTLGMFTDPARAKASGALFEGTALELREAPVPRMADVARRLRGHRLSILIVVSILVEFFAIGRGTRYDPYTERHDARTSRARRRSARARTS